jgi:outer membrane autotransporter protein
MSKTAGARPAAIAVAVAGALGSHLNAWSADFDPASPAVLQAYVGSATPEKVNAALTGLNNLIVQAKTIPGFGGFGGGAIFGSDFIFIGGGCCTVIFSPGTPLAFVRAASDADLGPLGAPVMLNNTELQALASFLTPRNFTVGPGSGTINTNGFDLTITGTITTTGELTKTGAGALILTGANPWGVAPAVTGGVLRGNTTSLQTSITNNAKVEFNQVGDGTYGNVVSGSGGVDKTGAGTLTITNSNTYLGATNILAGKLALQGAGAIGSTTAINLAAGTTFDLSAADGNRGVVAISGSGLISLGANRLATSTSSDSTFGGVISGSGGLAKGGNGVLTLSGINTYTGSTDIASGKLVLSGAGQIVGRVKISRDLFGGGSGVFDIGAASGNRQIGSLSGDGGSVSLGANTLSVGSDNASTIFSGSISGTGGITKTGSGTMTLDGVNSYSGPTTISQGTLAARAFSLSNNVVNNATLSLFRNKEGTPAIDAYSGNISGSGKLLKDGDDYIWLRGTNSYTGGTQINAGILIGNTQSLQGNITNNAGLAFYQVSDGAYSGKIDGTGVVFIYGPGAVAFGATATIQGNVAVGGRIARGDVLGNLNIAGDLAFVPGSSYRVRVDSAGNGDRIVLSGSSARATLLGGSVDVQAAAGAYQPQTRYTILSAPGGVTGQFAAASSNLAFLAPSLAYDPNTVFLTLTRNDVTFQSVAQTPDQAATGQLFTQLQTSAGSGDMALVLSTLTALSANEARAALDSIAAPGRAGLAQVIGFTQRAINQNVIGRLGLVESGGSFAPATGLAPGSMKLAFEETLRSDAAPVYAQAGGEFASRAGGFDVSLKHGFWLRGFAGSGRVDGDAANAGFDYRLGGIIAGYDHAMNDAVTLGAFGSYSEPKLDQDNSVSHTQTKSYQAGLYGRYRANAAHVDGIVSYAQNPTDSSRAVVVGALNRTATASFNGSTLSAQLEAGYTFKGRIDVTPLAGLQWTRQYQNDYTEQGAGALNLVVPSRTLELLRSTVGARALYPFESAGATRMALEARAGWAHEFRDQGALSARLAGDPTGASFSVTGISIPRDSAVLGLGLAAEAKRNLRVYAELSAEANGVQRTYGIAAGLRYRW